MTDLFNLKPKHIVDIHTHIFEEEYRERLIEEIFATDIAKELRLRRGSDGTLSSLCKSAEENTISRFFILPVIKDPRKIERINNYYYQESKKDQRVVFCGTLYPEHPRLKEIIVDLKSKDAKMIKLHSIYQRINILDHQSLKLFEKIIEADFPVIFDTSRIPPKYLAPDDKPEYYTYPGNLLKLHKLLPDLKIVAAHGGGLFITDNERKSLINSGIYIEISSSYYNCNWPQNNHQVSIRNLIYLLNNHDQDKIFFGTDSPWQNQKMDIQNLIKLYSMGEITRQQLENIFWKNANAFFNLGLK